MNEMTNSVIIGCFAYFVIGAFVIKYLVDDPSFGKKLDQSAGLYFTGQGGLYFIATVMGVVLWPLVLIVGVLLPKGKSGPEKEDSHNQKVDPIN